MYTIVEDGRRQSVAVPQAEHYAHRDAELKKVNFDEFTMGFRLEKAAAQRESTA